MNAGALPAREVIRCAFVAMLMAWLSACAAVRVQDASRNAEFDASQDRRRDDGGLSAAARETLLASGLDARMCRKAPGPCLARLAVAAQTQHG